MTGVAMTDRNATPERDLFAARALAVELAVAAGRLQLERRVDVVVHGTKAHANDLVSDVDQASEKLIVDALLAEWPADGVLAEEGRSAPARAGWRWVIDPLDGTRNYLSASGPWSVCLALQFEDVNQVAVVHDPAAGETFSAVRGAGATLNGEPVTLSGAARLGEAIVGLSFNPSPATKRRMAGLLGRLLPEVGDVRRLPAALDLCYLAAGRLDGSVCLDTKLWDIAAGLLIVEEAGAVLGGVDGAAGTELVIGATPAVWPELSALLAEWDTGA
jgi:myo-inositol-1(or 4)-monophosphatase